MTYRTDTGTHTETSAADWAHAHAPDVDGPDPSDADERDLYYRPRAFEGWDALTAGLEAAVADGRAELERRAG